MSLPDDVPEPRDDGAAAQRRRTRADRALRLRRFGLAEQRLHKRFTLPIRDGWIEHAFYPVVPLDTHDTEVLASLAARSA
jgi:hypothetical protein